VDRYTISRLAERTGTSPDTLRYYERIGILPAPVRSPAGYRLYDDGAVSRLRFIKGSQRLGLRLEEIGELLAVCDSGLCPCGRSRELLDERLALVEAEMAVLASLRDEIRTVLDRPMDDAGAECGCGGNGYIQLSPTRSERHERSEV
jgi:MerR family transcriptional regulator, mercuric resistance operon regulatory protein